MATNTTVVCRQGYGAVRYYASLPGTNDAIVLILLQDGHQDDDVLRDYDTVAELLGSGTGNLECTATGYVRKSIISGATIAPDNVNNRVDVGLPTQTWTSLGASTGAGSMQLLRAVLVCYQANISTGTDATLLVLSKHYYPLTADGNSKEVAISSFYRAAG